VQPFNPSSDAAISYVLIYRTPEYQKLKKDIDSGSKRLEKLKDKVLPIDKQKQHKKRVAMAEEQLKDQNRKMSMSKMKSTFFVMLIMLSTYSMLSSLFDGRPVAKLPFQPVRLMLTMSHRNLPGNDITDCSMIFIYVLCSFAIRANVQRFFGFAPKKSAPGAGMFDMPDDSKKTW
jgi:calcium load-activated calcium channel